MTSIVGFNYRGVAYLGADSAVSYGDNHVTVQSGRKLIAKNGYLFGTAGHVRYEQVLRYVFNPPPLPVIEDDYSGERLCDFLISQFIPALRACLTEFAGVYDQTKGEADSECLVAVRGHIFEIGVDLTVCRPDNGLFSVGSGCRVALGALHALHGVEASPEQRMLGALRAAAHYDKSCSPPFFWGRSDATDDPHVLPLSLS